MQRRRHLRWFCRARQAAATDPSPGARAYDERRLADAAHHFRAAVKEAEAFGSADPRLATALNNLAEFYRVQGELARAEPYYWRAIAIDEQALGASHLHLARDLNNLALLYRAQGRYADAEPLCRRALEIREAALGPEHAGVMATLNNLLALYLAQGKYSEAELLYRRALELKAKTFGPEHPAFASSLANYAALLRRTRGETEAARLEADAVLRACGQRKPDGEGARWPRPEAASKLAPWRRETPWRGWRMGRREQWTKD